MFNFMEFFFLSINFRSHFTNFSMLFNFRHSRAKGVDGNAWHFSVGKSSEYLVIRSCY